MVEGGKMSANSAADSPERPRDRFTWRPIAVAAALWLLTIFPLALDDLGGPIPPIWQMFDFLAILLAFLIFGASCLLALVEGRWYRATTRISALAALMVATFVTFHYRQDLKFHAARLSILTEIALHRTTDGRPRDFTRYFTDGNSDSWSFLEYDETDRDAPQAGQEVRTLTSYERVRKNGCPVTVRRLDVHLYLKTVDCSDPEDRGATSEIR
jgi:hypothetical protein